MSNESESGGPLSDLRVLDLTNVLAGPFCCHQLAHLGAEVIKVEAVRTGDLARQLGACPELNEKRMGASFLAQNAGKKSVTLNLKHSKGKALFHQLVRTADVLVENFRPGVMERLGLSWPSLKPLKPDLVYCAISGFGQEGPWSRSPAYDQIIQGVSGVMSVTGDDESGPLRVGYPAADTTGGITAAFAIVAALHEKPRGTFIDISMLESILASMGWTVSNWLIAGKRPTPNGNENLTSAPSGTFQASDALLNIAANKDEQWEKLAKHLGREDLLEDPKFATREDRMANRFVLKGELEQALQAKTARVWTEELNQIGVPAGEVLEIPEILEHEVVASRGLLANFCMDAEIGRSITVVRTGVKFNGKSPAVSHPPPKLGEHNQSVYQELGLSLAELEQLQEEGVI